MILTFVLLLTALIVLAVLSFKGIIKVKKPIYIYIGLVLCLIPIISVLSYIALGFVLCIVGGITVYYNLVKQGVKLWT